MKCCGFGTCSADELASFSFEGPQHRHDTPSLVGMHDPYSVCSQSSPFAVIPRSSHPCRPGNAPNVRRWFVAGATTRR